MQNGRLVGSWQVAEEANILGSSRKIRKNLIKKVTLTVSLIREKGKNFDIKIVPSCWKINNLGGRSSRAGNLPLNFPL